MSDPNIPLVDLHRHLDGNIQPATIFELAHEHGVPLPVNSLDELVPLTQVQDKTSDLMAFLQKLDYGISVLANADACYRVAYENFADASRQGLDYLELRFSPYFMAKAFDLNLFDVVEACVQGVRDGSRDYGIMANCIGILSRTFGVDICGLELDALLAHRDKFVALDLAGDELGFPAPLFVDYFRRGRDAGWQISVHAGEADGPQSVWNAIELLGASRIGHGVAAVQDDNLMTYLREKSIVIEACPTSNYQTATVVDIAHHPMKTFFERGITVTLNTDDPAVSNIDLPFEYKVARDTIGFSQAELAQIQRNGVEAAFLSDGEKRRLYAKKAAG